MTREQLVKRIAELELQEKNALISLGIVQGALAERKNDLLTLDMDAAVEKMKVDKGGSPAEAQPPVQTA